jgi:hypothetical protein
VSQTPVLLAKRRGDSDRQEPTELAGLTELLHCGPMTLRTRPSPPAKEEIASSASPGEGPASLLRGSTMASRRLARGDETAPAPRLASVARREIALDGGQHYGRRGSVRTVTAELFVDLAHTSRCYVQVEGDPGLRPVVNNVYPDERVEAIGVIRTHDPAQVSTTRDPDPEPVQVRFDRPFRRYGMGIGTIATGSPGWS